VSGRPPTLRPDRDRPKRADDVTCSVRISLSQTCPRASDDAEGVTGGVRARACGGGHSATAPTGLVIERAVVRASDSPTVVARRRLSDQIALESSPRDAERNLPMKDLHRPMGGDDHPAFPGPVRPHDVTSARRRATSRRGSRPPNLEDAGFGSDSTRAVAVFGFTCAHRPRDELIRCLGPAHRSWSSKTGELTSFGSCTRGPSTAAGPRAAPHRFMESLRTKVPIRRLLARHSTSGVSRHRLTVSSLTLTAPRSYRPGSRRPYQLVAAAQQRALLLPAHEEFRDGLCHSLGSPSGARSSCPEEVPSHVALAKASRNPPGPCPVHASR